MAGIFLLVGCGGRPILKKGAFSEGKILATTEAQPGLEGGDTESGSGRLMEVAIAVLDFQNTSPHHKWDFMRGTLADVVSARLASIAGFKVVERQRVREVLAELKLARTGAVDPTTAVQIGRLIGANIIVFGSVTQLGKDMLLITRLVKVETGEVVGGITERTNKVGALDEIGERVAKKIGEAIRSSH